LESAAFLPETGVFFHEVMDIGLAGLKLLHLRREFADQPGLASKFLFHFQGRVGGIGRRVFRRGGRRRIRPCPKRIKTFDDARVPIRTVRFLEEDRGDVHIGLARQVGLGPPERHGDSLRGARLHSVQGLSQSRQGLFFASSVESA
jgi:hypothetical protein